MDTFTLKRKVEKQIRQTFDNSLRAIQVTLDTPDFLKAIGKVLDISTKRIVETVKALEADKKQELAIKELEAKIQPIVLSGWIICEGCDLDLSTLNASKTYLSIDLAKDRTSTKESRKAKREKDIPLMLEALKIMRIPAKCDADEIKIKLRL